MALRSDARRNRDQLVEAAIDVFAEQGLDAPMDEIARRAQLGVGTLYRRFADRDELIVAAASAIMTRLAERARLAQQSESDAWNALTDFLRSCAAEGTGGLLPALDPELHTAIRLHHDVRYPREQLLETLEQLVMAARETGSLRDDVGSGDILLLAIALSRREQELPDRIATMAPTRHMQLLIDGLKPSSTTLPGESISAAVLSTPE